MRRRTSPPAVATGRGVSRSVAACRGKPPSRRHARQSTISHHSTPSAKFPGPPSRVQTRKFRTLKQFLSGNAKPRYPSFSTRRRRLFRGAGSASERPRKFDKRRFPFFPDKPLKSRKTRKENPWKSLEKSLEKLGQAWKILENIEKTRRKARRRFPADAGGAPSSVDWRAACPRPNPSPASGRGALRRVPFSRLREKAARRAE